MLNYPFRVITTTLLGCYLCLISSVTFAMSKPIAEQEVVGRGVTIQYQFYDKASLQLASTMTPLIEDAFESFTTLFGGLPRDLNGQTYRHILVTLRNGQHLGGEADPGVIHITWADEELFGYATWQTLLLHELFHLWSAESIRYQDPKEQWFNEGFAEYYAFRTAAELGLHEQKKALAILAHPVSNYLTARNLGVLSLRNAAADQRSKMENYFLIYNGGWLVALIIDMQIREDSQGEKSLDDLMQWLYQHRPRHKQLYTFDDIAAGLMLSTGLDFTGFLDDFVAGTQTVPVAKYFDLGRENWARAFDSSDKSDTRAAHQVRGYPAFIFEAHDVD